MIPRRVLLLALLLLVPAAPAGAATYMSCDARFSYGSSGFRLDRDSIKWRSRPAKCRHEIDGTLAGTVSLVDLKWRGWGGRTATATGFVLANHADQNGNFTRSPAHVSVRGRTRACRRGRRATFYTRLRVQLDGQPPAQWLPLYAPRTKRC